MGTMNRPSEHRSIGRPLKLDEQGRMESVIYKLIEAEANFLRSHRWLPVVREHRLSWIKIGTEEAVSQEEALRCQKREYLEWFGEDKKGT